MLHSSMQSLGALPPPPPPPFNLWCVPPLRYEAVGKLSSPPPPPPPCYAVCILSSMCVCAKVRCP